MSAHHTSAHPKIAFVGAGSTVFTTHIVGDVLGRAALSGAHIALMDVDRVRLEESELVARKIAATLGAPATITTHAERREALDGADFVVVSFQIGGYRPCTVTDFEVPRRHGLRQTIADTLGVGGIMRGLRTVPHLWALCEDVEAVCPDAVVLQHVNPMAINTWAIAARHPKVRQVGLCHSVQGTVAALAGDLGLDPADVAFRCAGINHVAFFTSLEEVRPDGTREDLYPRLKRAHAEGRLPGPEPRAPRCPDRVRYEVMRHLGHFVTESSEHFAEYVPWFLKRDRPDLVERLGIPLDEYPRRCEEQVAAWGEQARLYREAETIAVTPSHEYAGPIVDAVVTGRAVSIHGNVPNHGLIDGLPEGCAVEVACLVDRGGVQPTRAGRLPPQLTALMRTQVNVQELVVAALMEEEPEHLHHAAMLDPHTAAELDLDQIRALMDELLAAHGEWIPAWARPGAARRAA